MTGITGKMLRPVPALFLAIWMIATIAVPSSAYLRPGDMELLSVSPDGTPGDDRSMATSITPDGRFVALQSTASNLVPGDPPLCRTRDFFQRRCQDIYVRDRVKGVTELITGGFDGSGADNWSQVPALSADGRYVAFSSKASNLVPGDTNDAEDVFVHDRTTGSTTRVSVAPDGSEANGGSIGWSLSADGGRIAFGSAASNLVDGDTNGLKDVFVRDLVEGTTVRVSMGWDGSQPDGWGTTHPVISGNGRVVAFESAATNLVPGDTNADMDVFAHDLESGLTERVSVSTSGEQGDRYSLGAVIDHSGRHVAFWSMAATLVPGDQAECAWPPPLQPHPQGLPYYVNCTDAFVHDRVTGTTERVSVTSTGAEAVGASYPSWISPDGRYVGFSSSGLLPGVHDTDYHSEAFLHDRLTGVTEQLSVTGDGSLGDNSSDTPMLSEDLRYAAFNSVASNFVAGDGNEEYDAFVRDRGPALGVGGMTSLAQGGSAHVSGWATFSARVIGEARDSGSDGGPGASELGIELLGARVSARPELGDLLVRLDAVRIPAVHPARPASAGRGVLPGATALPGVVWGLAFDIGAVAHELRASRDGASVFGLYRCDPAPCIEVARVQGGIGTVGEAVVIAVPLEALGAQAGLKLSRVRAFAGIGDARLGVTNPTDEVLFGSAVRIPSARVELGVSPAGTAVSDVAFGTAAVLQDGSFSGSVGTQDLAPGSYDLWARACLDTICHADRTPIQPS